MKCKNCDKETNNTAYGYYLCPECETKTDNYLNKNMTIKQFILLPENKKAYWKALNWFMSFAISYITYQATDQVVWAVTVLPAAKVVSEMITRYINNAYKVSE